ncbi:MAG TPA: DNA replication/repair protein RecF [Rickettsiales bacterium]|nr:DNA replication/repair protein RecF [Rickettsiales bacterium]
MHILHLQTLALSNFRNYAYARLEVSPAPIVLLGANGAGKTNILEAISLLTPGRGIRRAKITDMDKAGSPAPWAIAAELTGEQGEVSVGTGREADTDKRIVKIDGKMARAQTDLGQILAVLWLTPQMDNLFIEGNSERRRFIDRLVFSFDSEHAARVNAYEQVMRERNRLLQNGNSDGYWFAALEQKMAENAVAIAVARSHTIDHLNNAMQLSTSPFPKAHIALSGETETLLAQGPALAAEEQLKELLRMNRAQDAGAGRCLIGIHRTQVDVLHMGKQMAAELCSTGEQKAVLISIILAQARAGALWHGHVPVLLLDEVATHLDISRREALFAELTAIGAQSWLTGTDRNVFDGLEAQYFLVESGKVERSE